MANKKKAPIRDEKTAFNELIKTAIEALKSQKYKVYIRCLDNLGILSNKIYKNQNRDYHSITNQTLKLEKIKWLESYIDTQVDLPNPLAYCIFEEAWKDDYLKDPILVNGINKNRRFLSPKGNLNRSTRHNINLGLRAIALSIKKNSSQSPNIVPQQIVARLDKEACQAIKSYKTKKQHILEVSGTTIAVIMSIVCSIITAAAVAITLAAWPVAVVGAIALVVFAATLVINWFSFRSIIPRMLSDMFGKDHFFEGWTIYRDPETGEKIRMSFARKIALGISSAIATVLGMATAAVTYGFIINLGKLALFPFLAAGTIGAACLPPLGIVIATVFGISSIVLMMKPILNFCKSTSIKSILAKPFANTAMIFDPANPKNAGKSLTELKIEKGITYTILGVMSAFTLFGLVVLQIQNGAALGSFLSQTMAISSAIAVGVAYTISMASTLIGQLPYALNSLGDTLVAIVTGYRNVRSSLRRKTHETESSNPSVITNKVVNGIKDTVKIIAPTESIKNDATTARIAKICNLNTNHHEYAEITVVPSSSIPTIPKKPSRDRYYQLFLFAKKDCGETPPSAPTISNQNSLNSPT